MLTADIHANYNGVDYLRRKLVAQTDPDRLSILIAVDCLRKLAGHLPDYQRVLDICLTLVESGLLLRSSSGVHRNNPVQSETRFYFEEYSSLLETLEEERERKIFDRQVSMGASESSKSVSEQIVELFERLGDDDPLEKESLFLRFLKTNMDLLASLASTETIKYFINHSSDDKRTFFLSLLSAHLHSEAANRLFRELLNSHELDFKRFLHENLPVMDSIILTGESSVGATSILHRLVDRHYKEFATILWESPFLVSRVFQVRFETTNAP